MTDGMINDLISLYHDLNGASVDELREPPSALEFMKYVAKNRPFIVRQGMSHSPALHKWNCEYLKRVLGPAPVKVAITPNGSASRFRTAFTMILTSIGKRTQLLGIP